MRMLDGIRTWFGRRWEAVSDPQGGDSAAAAQVTGTPVRGDEPGALGESHDPRAGEDIGLGGPR